jgi:hypothetical protein
MYIGLYGLIDSMFTTMEAENMEDEILGEGIFLIPDPLEVVDNHRAYVAIIWPYSHQENPKEDLNKRALLYEELHVRIQQAIEVEEEKKKKR